MTLVLISFHPIVFPYTSVLAASSDYNRSGVMIDDSYCSYHKVCGANGNCDLNKAPACVCLEGFTPKSPSGSDSLDYTQGCVRQKALNCTTDVFFKYGVFQLPSGTYSLLNQSLAEEDCKERCFSNCSCVAYSYTTTGVGISCQLWTGDLFDVRVIKEGGKVLYIRMPALELSMSSSSCSQLLVVIIHIY